MISTSEHTYTESAISYFVCYHFADKDRVMAIIREMNANAIPIWYESDETVFSKEPVSVTVIQKIKDCREMLVFITRNMLMQKSERCLNEHETARRFGKRIHYIVLDQVSFEEVDDSLKAWFTRMQRVQVIQAFSDSPKEIVSVMEHNIQFCRMTNHVDLLEILGIRIKAFTAKHKKTLTGISCAVLVIVAALFIGYGAIDNLRKNVNPQNAFDTFSSSDDLSKSIFEYMIDNDTVAITGLKEKNVVELIIPETIDGKKVVAIGNHAFSGNSQIVSVKMPSNVTSIGLSAFESCSSLRTIDFSDGLLTIDAYAFRNCSQLSEIKMPGSLVSLGDGVLEQCSSLREVVFSDDLKSLGSRSFANCTQLEDVYIPDSVISIGEHSFDNCISMETLKLSANLSEISAYCFFGCKKLSSVTVPENVTSLYAGCFENCTDLVEVSLGKKIEFIDSTAFDGDEIHILWYANEYTRRYAEQYDISANEI